MIETNHIERGINRKIIEGVFQPGLMEARSALPALQEENRPLAVASITIQRLTRQLLPGVGTARPAQASTPSPGKLSGPRGAMFEKHRESHAVPPEKADFSSRLEELTTGIDLLAARGTRVVFFEMPVDAELCASPHLAAIREELGRIGSERDIPYLQVDDCAAYTTTDGHHLDKASAERFTGRLRRQIDSLPRS
jgi:hypothetical protein